VTADQPPPDSVADDTNWLDLADLAVPAQFDFLPDGEPSLTIGDRGSLTRSARPGN